MDFAFLVETNWVDIIVAIFLIRGGYIGIKQGFSVEIFKTLAVIASAVLSLFYYQKLAEWLSSHSFLSLQNAGFLSFLVLIITLLLIFKVVRILLFAILHLELFYGLEKWGGLILGLGRSIVLASLFLFVLTLLPVKYIQESVEVKSFSGAYLKGIAPKVLDFVVQFKPKAREIK